eukprot:TRINITY_DN4717_c0_g1_i1.p1 TRINITY_DN4717_c0_g1~~TRINITY_DN4717_c0_g1_i1.p1  ORF type:complete len:106 (+),score=14.37 TRINITY_DN4717_c0_g1_i1:286-603(+)
MDVTEGELIDGFKGSERPISRRLSSTLTKAATSENEKVLQLPPTKSIFEMQQRNISDKQRQGDKYQKRLEREISRRKQDFYKTRSQTCYKQAKKEKSTELTWPLV